MELSALRFFLLVAAAVICTTSAFVTPMAMPQQVSVQVQGRGQLQMMRHQKRFKKLNKPADQRKALLRGLTTELIRHGRIETTLVRAKAMRKPVDHMITLAKEGSLHKRRQALAYIYDKTLVHALFEQAPEVFGNRPGGYTRIKKCPYTRRGDNAEMAIIELVVD
eukprot:CAMPEP_0113935386 /NCGR_PEP_ID=MMETSP1339-20121228/2542_1 /TAXON_ID=94617 /ORGANISM="Fibrocapsa japonica" /LENGTH=164 /DNA_ID=CAMNT_0000937523 /DNA_START=83 /DNA_END=577 /DNA_ORIENTATION=+ /assembly_acc=CAM_ASM_000762